MNITKINYIEFKAADLDAIKTFYGQCFGWEFVDYGPDYVAFTKESGLDGGFARTEKAGEDRDGHFWLNVHLNLREK